MLAPFGNHGSHANLREGSSHGGDGVQVRGMGGREGGERRSAGSRQAKQGSWGLS